MRIIDPIAERAVDVGQVYLTASEARYVIQRLEMLLEDPEAAAHFHVCNEASRDLSFSIVTATKLASRGYAPLEQTILAGMPGL